MSDWAYRCVVLCLLACGAAATALSGQSSAKAAGQDRVKLVFKNAKDYVAVTLTLDGEKISIDPAKREAVKVTLDGRERKERYTWKGKDLHYTTIRQLQFGKEYTGTLSVTKREGGRTVSTTPAVKITPRKNQPAYIYP